MKTIGKPLFGGDDTYLAASHVDGMPAIGVHTLTIPGAINGTAGDDNLTGTAGNDVFDLSQGGNDTASGLAGNDSFMMGATLNAGDHLDGGTSASDFDVVQINGDYSAGLTLGATTLVNFEDLQMIGGHSYNITMNDGNVAAGVQMNIDAGSLGVGDTLIFNGSAEQDGSYAIESGAGHNNITGGAGSDFIQVSAVGSVNIINTGGSAGDDNGGDSVFFGAAFTAADQVNGVDGNTFVQLSGDYSAGVTMNANTLQNVGELFVTSGANQSQVFNYTLVENDGNVAAGGFLTVTGNLAANEYLHFDGSAETDGAFLLTGGAGNDILIGGAGDDFFKGKAGDDYIDGGAGKNRATFSDDTAGVTVTLYGQGHAQNTGDGNDTLKNIQDISGGSGNDTITGDANANWLWGEGGNDTIVGNGGNDVIQIGSLGTGIVGTDNVDGGGGFDTLSFDDNGGGSLGVTFSLALQGTQQTTNEAIVTANNFENVSGTSGNDFLTGNSGANDLYGSAGNDTLVGGAGNDLLYGDKAYAGGQANGGGDGPTGPVDADPGTGGDDVLIGGLGNDTLDGGEGNNTAAYTDATAGIKVSLLITGAQYTGVDGSDTLINIQNLTGSDYNDTLTGDSHDNILAGGAGNDLIYTGGGNDTVTGGDGNDTVYYNGAGTLDFQGGAGTDTLDAHLVAFDTTFVLDNDVENFVGGSGADTVSLIDPTTTVAHSLQGGAGDDSLTAGAGNDRIDGGDGNDSISISEGGTDTVTADAGDDTIFAIASGSVSQPFDVTDRINGGAGNDTLYLTGDYSAGMTVPGAALVSVENLILGGGFSYRLVLNDASVAAGTTLTVDASELDSTHTLNFNGAHETDGSFFLIGGDGADILTGGAGADTFESGLGNDKITGGGGADTFIFGQVADSTGFAHDTVVGFNGTSGAIFELDQAVTGVDSMVTAGQLRSSSNFDHDLQIAIGSSQLAAHHAVIFTASSGNLSGHTYLVVDANGTAGYQAGQDYVIELTSGTNLASITTANFHTTPVS